MNDTASGRTFDSLTFNRFVELSIVLESKINMKNFIFQICSQPYSYKHDFTRHCLKKHGVFLKGRQVHVLNEEVLVKERAIMSDLKLRINGTLKDDNPINPFKGPHAVKVFEQAVKALEARQIQTDVLP